MTNYEQTKKMYQDYPFLKTHRFWFNSTIRHWAQYYHKQSNSYYALTTAYADGWNSVLTGFYQLKPHQPEKVLISYFTTCIRNGMKNGLKRAMLYHTRFITKNDF